MVKAYPQQGREGPVQGKIAHQQVPFVLGFYFGAPSWCFL
jgi:hypothetical protein